MSTLFCFIIGFIVAILLPSGGVEAQGGSDESDRDALLAFKNGLTSYADDAFDTTNGKWTNATLPCDRTTGVWEGLTCDAFGRVTNVELKRKQMAGNIATEIGLLDRLRWLNLDNNQLMNLPSEIGQVPLEALWLSNNSVSSLPFELWQLHRLILLSFDGNQLNTLATEIGQLTSLTTIDFSRNAIETLPSEIGQLPSLGQLIVAANQFTFLPSEIGHLSALTYLQIAINKLTALPTELGVLTGLSELFMDENQVTALPTEIGLLTRLIYLSASANQLSSLPTELGLLRRLLFFIFPGNQLTILPTEIGRMTPLRFFEVGSNKLTDLPSEIGQLDSLLTINALENQLESLPSEMGMLTALVTLYLSRNKLSSVPIELFHLSIESLHIAECELTVLPTEIGMLTALSFIVADSNKLTNLPSEIGQLTLLLQLWVQDNEISQTLPSEIGQLTLLNDLRVYSNNFHGSLPSEIGSLEGLQEFMLFSNSFSGTLPAGMSDYTALISFYAQDNNFDDYVPTSWDSLVSLKNMDLSNSGLLCDNLVTKCSMDLLLHTGSADSVVITTQPPPTYANDGPFSDSVTAQTSICEAGRCTLVPFPNNVIAITIEPSALVKTKSGGSVQTLAGVATFDAFQFVGKPGQSYVLVFSVPATSLNPVTSSVISIPPCSVLVNDSVPDPEDEYDCTCPPGYYLSASESACRQCPSDTYMGTNNGAATCIACSSIQIYRTTNRQEGSTASSACVCAADYFPSAEGTDCFSCRDIPNVLDKVVDCVGESQRNNSGLANVSFAGIDIREGYWLTADKEYLEASNSMDQWFDIIKCPYSAACPGGVTEEECKPGHTGPVCYECEDDHGKVGNNCAKCPSKTASYIILTAILLLMIFACVVVVYFSHSDGDGDEDFENDSDAGDTETCCSKCTCSCKCPWAFKTDALGLKIAITHLQIIGLVGNFSTEWPKVFLQVFNIPTSAATMSPAASIFAISCVFSPSVYLRAFLYFVLPLILAAGVIFGYLCLNILTHRSSRRLKDRILSSKTKQGIVALLYVAHPGIVQGLLETIDCYKVGTKTLAFADMSINCKKDNAFIALQAVVSVYLAIYGFGGLFAVYNKLNRKKVSSAFTFLTQGYQEEQNYWDVATTTRKLVLAILSVFAPPALQLFFAIWILLFSIWSIMQHSPYTLDKHKQLDQLSLVTLLLTVSVGMLYYTDIIEPNSSDGLIVAIILILINSIVVLVLLFRGATQVDDGGPGSNEGGSGREGRYIENSINSAGKRDSMTRTLIPSHNVPK